MYDDRFPSSEISQIKVEIALRYNVKANFNENYLLKFNFNPKLQFLPCFWVSTIKKDNLTCLGYTIPIYHYQSIFNLINRGFL